MSAQTTKPNGMDKDLLQTANTALNVSDYIRRQGQSPAWGMDDWRIVEEQLKLALDHIRMAHGGKLPSELQQRTSAGR